MYILNTQVTNKNPSFPLGKQLESTFSSVLNIWKDGHLHHFHFYQSLVLWANSSLCRNWLLPRSISENDHPVLSMPITLQAHHHLIFQSLCQETRKFPNLAVNTFFQRWKDRISKHKFESL